MKPVVIVEHVSKRFSRNPHAHLNYGAADLIREIFGKVARGNLRKDEFFAVDDVSFHLEKGDSFALIGRNGSGKTTMLKMMNGLLKPDRGTIIMDGRVQALINLSAGFNMALSGRDNIYNSASLMGLTRGAIDDLVAEIIEFSELQDAIDSPVGTYSSGMSARLGFSVAISLKPDILLIDEILAVGDFAFQNKCFAKLHELKQAGVAFVMVSHNHTNIVQICERALWLEKGRCVEIGKAADVVKNYLDYLNKDSEDQLKRLKVLQESNTEAMRKKASLAASESIYDVMYTDFDRVTDLEFSFMVDGNETTSVRVHDEVELRYSFTPLKRVTDLNVSLVIYSKDGLRIAAVSTLNGDLLKDIHEGTVRCTVRIPDFNLNPGEYVLVMPIHEGKSYLWRGIVHQFVVTAPNKLTWELVDLRCEYTVEAPMQKQLIM